MAAPRAERGSVRRKIAVATWRPSRDGRLYGRVELDATAGLAYVERQRRGSGVPITLTHLVGKAVAMAQAEVPETCCRVVFGRIVPFPSVDVSFAVDVDGGEDLGPVKVHRADAKSVVEIAAEVTDRADRLRRRGDPNFERSAAWVRRIPVPFMRPTLAGASFLLGGLGVPALGQPGFPLGSALVSSVSRFGLDEGYMAPVPFARAALYVLVGGVRDVPMAVDGQVVVRPQLVVTATADHRLVDGAHAGAMAKVLRRVLEHPECLHN